MTNETQVRCSRALLIIERKLSVTILTAVTSQNSIAEAIVSERFLFNETASYLITRRQLL